MFLSVHSRHSSVDLLLVKRSRAVEVRGKWKMKATINKSESDRLCIVMTENKTLYSM